MYKRALREEAILLAAKKLFYSKGYLRTTMDEIALEADISKPTVYQYFENKEELYFSITAPIFKHFVDDMNYMTQKLNNDEYLSGEEIIHEHFKRHIQIFENDPRGFRVFMALQYSGAKFELDESISRVISTMARERYNGMRKLYARAIEKGLIKDMNVYHLVDMIWGCFHGILQSLDIKKGAATMHKEFLPTLKFACEVITRAVSVE